MVRRLQSAAKKVTLPDGAGQYRSAEAEFGYYATDPYADPAEREPLHDTVDVAVVGGGFGGILAGARMRQQGVERVRIIDTAYELDCLIFATGFSLGASGVTSGKLPVHGRGGTQLLHAWAQHGPRTLHGFTCNGFPNLILMGSLQNASSVNFTHVLDEQAVHAAALVATAEDKGALIEPSREAEDDWIATMAEGAPDHEWFHAECTPGYYNREGRGRPNGPIAYPHGAFAFHELLKRWREESMNEVLQSRTPARSL